MVVITILLIAVMLVAVVVVQTPALVIVTKEAIGAAVVATGGQPMAVATVAVLVQARPRVSLLTVVAVPSLISQNKYE